MAEKNKRNSRDDKSKPGERRRTGFDRSKKPGKKFGDKKENPKTNFANKDFKPGKKRTNSDGFKNFREKQDKPKAFKVANSITGFRASKRNSIKKEGEQGSESYKYHREKKIEKNNRLSSKKRDIGYLKPNDEQTTKNNPTKRNLKKEDDLIRLNRYISNAGICSRRKADELITAGAISVNHEVIKELGHKIDPYKDEVRYNNELLKREKKIYVLLNKPKDYITTTDDPQERRTVMQLVDKAGKERIYPVGRLDRNTTGLLLMTNDGDLAEKLSHPRNGITKIYHVELNKNLTQGDFNKIKFGLELEDGFIKPDHISYVTGADKREIGIQIHSGKNRIVRRIFEHLGYEVVKLDRVVYGNLTKKDLPRGRWRYLEEHELIQIKHLIK